MQLSPEIQAQIDALLAQGLASRDIARQLGIGKSTVNNRRHELGAAEQHFSESPDGTASLSLHTDKPIKSLEDLIRVAQIDTSIWFVKHYKVSAWTVPMKLGSKGNKVGVQTQQYRVAAQLMRLVPRSLQTALDALYERMAKHAPKYPKLPARKTPTDSLLGVFGVFDAHFGKLCWEPETGSNYDLKIAEQVFRNAVRDLLGECRNRPLERALFPLGNDLLHFDSKRLTTFKGTQVDVDGRYAKVFEAALLAVIWAIEQIAAVCPVDVVWVPGNHDPTVSYHLARTVAAWFRQSNRVKVDASPKVRKYYAWGSNLIGLTHGDVPRPEDLPGLMAAECREQWADCAHREWLVGHQHRSRQWVTKSTDTHKGTVVRVLRAITGTDAWHYEQGFTGQSPGAEVYWYRFDRGYAGHAIVPARV